MKEKVFELIKERNGRINFRELKSKLKIDTTSLENLLLELKLEGKILQTSNKYSLFPDDLLIGDVSTNLSGDKVIFYDNMKIPVAEDSFNALLFNDVVAFRINSDDKAEVVSIIDRRIKNITCEVIVEDGVKKVIPYHKDIKVSLDKSDMKELLDGDIIVVDIDVNSDDEYCNAILVKKLDIKNSPNKQEIETAISYGFLSNDYSDEYMEELAKSPKEVTEDDTVNRTDFRKLRTYTTDGSNTKDMDDAWSVQRLENGDIRVYVHIADVSHYVKVGSKIFERACEVTTSLYLNNTVFPMLHHTLSNGICSLNQAEDRLTKTVIMDIDKDGNIYNTKIVKSVINSNKKMTYDDVDEILLGKSIPSGYEAYVDDIKLGNEVAIRIRKRMERNGMISFASDELNKKYDSDGKLISYQRMGESPARKMIEFLMIATNSEVAKFLYNSPLPGVFRIHEYPELRKINEAIRTLNQLGKRIRPLRELDSPIALQKVQKSLQNDEDYQIVSSILLRHLKRAGYSTINIGHFALALYFYTHFTSPIRRLPDLLVHILLDILLEEQELIEEIDFDLLRSKLDRLCGHASYMSRQADLAEKEADKNSIIMEMKNHIGEEYECTIIDIGSRLRVRINSIDTWVSPKCLGDNFKYNKKKEKFYDMESNTYLNIGSKGVAVLNGVDEVNKNLKISILGLTNEKKLIRTR